MSSVFLLSAASIESDDPKALLDLEQMRQAAHADRLGSHGLAEDPAEADLVLFVETSSAAGRYFERVRRAPIYREFAPKSYLFSSTDKVVPLLPGVYASIERRWYLPAWTRSGPYLGVRERGPLRYDPGASPSRLFSFVGAAQNHPIRRRVMRLQHPDGVLLDSSSDAQRSASGVDPATGDDPFLERFTSLTTDSAFVLCPRGGGASTFRIFEAMMLGRAPVIVSDQWVPPSGPKWERFSLRVPEREVETIPELLEAHRGAAPEMGAAARAAWLEWFSPEVSFHRTVDWCLELAARADERSGARRCLPHLQMLRPYHTARWAAGRLSRRLA